ncbi:hypothetical protein [Amycolatopsis sp. RTGN1]|uniref:hypothetical protein n=1 Tax=Amycolatopsis ponsaeliensis TaxID=2992142 RepID=UPI00254A9C04|nr:hypothetical protein [Amycolatopsis sp. RTGN1]
MDKISGGMWTVLGGLAALLIVTVVAILAFKTAADVVSVVTAAGAVIGTLVGAFFGVSAGQAGRAEAEAAKDQAHRTLVNAAAKAAPDSPVAEAILAGA